MIEVEEVQLITESGTHLILTAVGRLKRFKLLLVVENSILRLYRPGQPNWEYKMGKILGFFCHSYRRGHPNLEL